MTQVRSQSRLQVIPFQGASMNRKLISLLAAATLSLAACSSGTSEVRRDTSDFFTKLSQGYRIQTRSLLPADAMWTTVDVKTFADIDRLEWAKSVSGLMGHIMRQQGIMDGQLFILFKIHKGEIQGEVKLCQPVENPVKETDTIHVTSQPARMVARTIHKGKRDNLGTAFRVLEEFAAKEGFEVTGWAMVQSLRGSTLEMDASDYRTEAQLYIK